MSGEPKFEIRMLSVDDISPNPFQPRETFPKDEIEQLADTIKKVGLLQPISVRKKGRSYQIISGERRWRAAQLAGLKEIPAIIKDVSDSQLMIESLIENVHRKDLEPIEKARGLAEVYKLAGFEPAKVQFQLKHINDALTRPERHRELTDDEKKIKEVADMVGLSYDYQYRLLTLLRFTPEEQKLVSELKLGYEEASSIATIERPEVRKKVIEIAPELKREEIKKISKIVKMAPEPIVEAVLKREVTPEVAEEIAKIEKPDIMHEALEIAKKGVYTVEGIRTRIERLMKPPIELPEEPIEIQIFNKIMWNLQRIGEYDFYTIGFAKRTPDQFLQLLKAKGIKTLVDVRFNPVSMFKPEFNKDNLSRILKQNNIKYVHYPELGVPEDIREKLAKTGDYEWFFKWYDENVVQKRLAESVDLESLSYPIAIMCVELDPTKCHRHRIALWLEKVKGLRGYDL
jgi:ParB family chromosome partitioning protein